MRYPDHPYRVWVACFVLHVLLLPPIISQVISPFDELPVIPSLQGQSFNVYAGEDKIYVVGDLLLDTLSHSPWQVVKPYFAVFEYDGSFMFHSIMETDDSLMYYRIRHRPIFVRDGFAYIYFDKISYIEPTEYPELVEIDILSGDITRRFSLSENPFNEPWVGVDGYSCSMDKSIISYNYLDGGRLFIRKVDSTFALVNEFVVEENGRLNAPFYIEQENDSSFILAGVSVLRDTAGDFVEIKPFYMIVNETGKIDQFNLFPGLLGTHVSPSCGTCFSYLRDSDQNWFLANSTNLPPEVCQSCTHDVPVASLVSSDFSSVIWTNYFSPRPIDSFQDLLIKSSDVTHSKKGYVVAGYDFTEFPAHGFLARFSFTGQRLWYRSFLPSAWEQDSGRVVWGIIEDVKSTPYGTFIMAGNAYDGYEEIRRPWLVHVDSMGCLIPGCGNIVSTEYQTVDPEKMFLVSPNPTTDNLYLQYQGIHPPSGQVRVLLSDPTGAILRTASIDISPGTQYIFSITSLPPGHYYLTLENADRSSRQVETIIRL